MEVRVKVEVISEGLYGSDGGGLSVGQIESDANPVRCNKSAGRPCCLAVVVVQQSAVVIEFLDKTGEQIPATSLRRKNSPAADAPSKRHPYSRISKETSAKST